MMMITTTAALALLSAAPAHVDTTSSRDRLLIEARPWPANRVDSPDRAENGRLWHTRTPIGNRTPLAEQWWSRIGAANFGAPAELNDQLIYTLVNHAPIAISPWRAFDDNGFDDFRRAQNTWLREQGWVLKVRTHVNPMRYGDPVAAAETPAPRATIEINTDPSAPKFPSKMRVEDDAVRIFKPMAAQVTGPIHVVEPAPEPDATVVATPTEQ